MKTVIHGKATCLRECADFAMERCKAHGFHPIAEPLTTGNGIAVSARISFSMPYFEISICQEGKELSIESTAQTIPFNFVMILFLPRTKRILKTIHSEIVARFESD